MPETFLQRFADSDLPATSRLIVALATLASHESRETDSNGTEIRPLRLRIVNDALGSLVDDNETNLHLLRIAQLALGGCGSSTRGRDPALPVYGGYTAVHPLELNIEETNQLSAPIVRSIQSGGVVADEAGRLAAMLNLHSGAARQAMLDRIELDSNAVGDIHWMICISKCFGEFSRPWLADSLVGLRKKLSRQGAQVDRNWQFRISELTSRLFEDREFALLVLEHADFGGSEQEYIARATGNSRELENIARKRTAEKVAAVDADVAAWQLELIGRGNGYQDLLRKFSAAPNLTDAVVTSLARDPATKDRQLFIQGLKSSNLSIVRAAAQALRKLKSVHGDDEISALRVRSSQETGLVETGNCGAR